MQAQEQGFYQAMHGDAKDSINKHFHAFRCKRKISIFQKLRAQSEHIALYRVLSSPLMISISSSSDFCSKWVYASSVCWMVAWPKYLLTATIFAPDAIALVAQQWRRSCRRMRRTPLPAIPAAI